MERRGRPVGNSTCDPVQQLPSALQLHILSFLPPNEVALSGRLVSPDTAAALTGPDHCTASLSQPLPPHAVPWAVEAGQQHVRQLSLIHKLGLLYTAATSGSEVNLEVALALLQPSVFPELLQRWLPYAGPDPGCAAVKSGHPQLLDWLLRHCPALLHRRDILTVAARHCDLAGLQAAWEVLQAHPNSDRGGGPAPALGQAALDAAAGGSGRSGSGETVAKMEWLLEAGRGMCSLQHSTVEAAARSGDLGRLRWLRDRGCPMGGQFILCVALRHADLAVAQWLVDEAGCELPESVGSSDEHWLYFLRAAASSGDALAKWQWLQERGAPPLDGGSTWVSQLCGEAARAGQLPVVRHLLSSFGPDEVLQQGSQLLELQVAGCRSVPVMDLLHQSGLVLSCESYLSAVEGGDLAMIRWLACDAGVSAAELQLQSVIELWGVGTRGSGSMRRDLLEAVRLLVGQAGCSGLGGGGDGGNGDDDCSDDTGYDGDGDCENGHDGNGDEVNHDDDDDGGGDGGGGGGWGSDGDMGGEDSLLGTAMRWCGLDLVQYLMQQQPGLQPRRTDLAAAAGIGCKALLEWLAEHHPGCLADQQFVNSPYVLPAMNGDLGTLIALRRLGVPWGAADVLVRAVQRGCPVPALRWLAEQGAPVGGTRAMEAAVADKRCSCSKERAWLLGLAAANSA